MVFCAVRAIAVYAFFSIGSCDEWYLSGSCDCCLRVTFIGSCNEWYLSVFSSVRATAVYALFLSVRAMNTRFFERFVR